ncbi:hypothetical protein TNCV_3011051 [Trichonephila clavipes]|nr:hypothetical protein TNCV_3011051 [Trichonephila clavipes]
MVKEYACLKSTRIKFWKNFMLDILELSNCQMPIAVARSYCYWQGINASIANFVQNCSACIATRNEPARINRHPWEWPNGPWQRIHVDYAGPFMGKCFCSLMHIRSG